MQPVRALIAAAGLALAFAAAHAAHAADVKPQPRQLPGFNDMDKDRDGALTRSEAGSNPPLVQRFNEVDANGDGKLSRYEYVKAMAREDFRALRERIAEFIEPEPEPESATSGDTKMRR